MICYYCNTEKEESLFYRTSGKQPMCKACHAKYISNYLKTRPEKTTKNREYAKKSKPRRRKERKQFTDWLKRAPCTDCGKTYHPEVMDFDHIQDGPKGGWKYAIAHQIARAPSEAKLWESILKCEIVCAVCHRIRTIRRRIGDEAYYAELNRA